MVSVHIPSLTVPINNRYKWYFSNIPLLPSLTLGSFLNTQRLFLIWWLCVMHASDTFTMFHTFTDGFRHTFVIHKRAGLCAIGVWLYSPLFLLQKCNKDITAQYAATESSNCFLLSKLETIYEMVYVSNETNYLYIQLYYIFK